MDATAAPARMDPSASPPSPVAFVAADGYPLNGFLWRHTGPGAERPVVVINAATSVRCRYYARFAAFLHAQGLDVLSYDYRGIGESRPARLRGFEAGWIDWGRLDCEAALQFALASCTGQPLHVVGHSVGGFLIGLAASSHRVARVFTMGAQFAHWRDYRREQRLRLLLKWHLVMPALTALCGYFPGRRLGWLEDTPRGVVRDWTAPHPRFEDNWRRGALVLPEPVLQLLLARFAALRGPTLALSLSDDEFGTPAAVQRLLGYYRNSPRTHLHLRPEAVGQARVGHFAFFHGRFEPSLWRLPLEWLRHGRLPAQPQGEVVTMAAEAPAPSRAVLHAA
jgi:predicted alpha/beta hydrolase